MIREVQNILEYTVTVVQNILEYTLQYSRIFYSVTVYVTVFQDIL